jgi:hypothetical protein
VEDGGKWSSGELAIKFCLIAFSEKLLIVVSANTRFSGFVETRFYLIAF